MLHELILLEGFVAQSPRQHSLCSCPSSSDIPQGRRRNDQALSISDAGLSNRDCCLFLCLSWIREVSFEGRERGTCQRYKWKAFSRVAWVIWKFQFFLLLLLVSSSREVSHYCYYSIESVELIKYQLSWTGQSNLVPTPLFLYWVKLEISRVQEIYRSQVLNSEKSRVYVSMYHLTNYCKS